MANTVSSVLSIAASQLGLSDGTKYGKWYVSATGASKWYAASGVAWCAMFVSWVFNQAGAKCVGLPNAYCPNIYQAAKGKGKTVSAKNAKPGDVVLFDWNANANPDHVGIVEKNYGTYVQTIEGNVSGKVQRRTRAYSVIQTCIRPDYSAVESGKTNTTTSKLAVDGVFGAVTCKALQTQLQRRGYYKGYLIDGVWGPYTKKEYQRYLTKLGYYNRAIDGVFGTYSVMAEQRRLAALGLYDRAIDGDRGTYTKMALQKALNAGTL